MRKTTNFHIIAIVLFIIIWSSTTEVCKASFKDDPLYKSTFSHSCQFSQGNCSAVLKTNLFLLGGTIANIGIEFPISKQFSIDIPFVYTPYSLRTDKYFRLLIVQPEFRYWIKNPLHGLYLGVHSHLAYFNVAVNSQFRYQDQGGNTPLIGFGLGLGYDICLSDHWGLDLIFGYGYVKYQYDIFINSANGARIGTGIKAHFAPTRLGIALTYKMDWSLSKRGDRK